jgi:hypothetical protein
MVAKHYIPEKLFLFSELCSDSATGWTAHRDSRETGHRACA